MKNIVINFRQLQSRYTGVQSYIYNLSKTLIILYPKVEFTLATLNYNGGNKFIDELGSFPNAKIRNTKAKLGIFSDIIFDHFLVSSIIEKNSVYFNPVNITPLIKKNDVKYIVGVLDLCTFVVPETTTVSLKTYYRLFLPSSIIRADHIISISKSTKTDIINIFGTNPTKISVVYLGVDKEIKQSKTNINSKDPYIFMMATSRRKNIKNILHAYSIFAKDNPSIKGKILINNTYMTDEILGYIKHFDINLKNIKILSNYTSKSNLSKLYQQSVCFVYCPVYEGFGLPVLEAMKCGCPVVTSNSSSLPEISSDAALKVNPLDPIQISIAMNKIVSSKSLRDSLVKKGKSVSAKFDWEISAKKLYKILSSIS